MKLWFCRHVLGYIPAGHLVLFSPLEDALGLQVRDPHHDPEIGVLGLSLGRWDRFTLSGFTATGTRVLIDSRHYDLYTCDLSVLNN